MCGEKRSFSKPCGVHDECAAFPLTFLFPIFEKPLLFSFDIQPKEGPSIRAETSYPIASLWLEMRENCGNDCPSKNIIQKSFEK